MYRKMIVLILIILLVNQDSILAKHSGLRIGEMLSWDEVNELLPKYSIFTVHDISSGKEFSVQRRAGSNHADVQPLSKEDTKIMKEIYGGKWSWKRRSIIVMYNGKMIAASMHGMPHGGGALQNNFPGHFCIHFFGSTTHRSGTMDLSHLIMILKASDRLDEYLTKSSPFDIVYAYIATLEQQDPQLIQTLTHSRQINWEKLLPSFEHAVVENMSVLPAEDVADLLSIEVPVELTFLIKSKGKVTFDGEVELFRFSPSEPWRVNAEKFITQLNVSVTL